MNMKKQLASIVLRAVLVATAASLSPAWAQNFPNKPHRLIVPTPAGGGYDIAGRVVGERMGLELGQPRQCHCARADR